MTGYGNFFLAKEVLQPCESIVILTNKIFSATASYRALPFTRLAVFLTFAGRRKFVYRGDENVFFSIK